MRVQMSLNFGDNDPAAGLGDLDRVVDRRQLAAEREVNHGAANRDHPPLQWAVRRHRILPLRAHGPLLRTP